MRSNVYRGAFSSLWEAWKSKQSRTAPDGSKLPLMQTNRKIRPKCGVAGLEIKPLLQFHVISVLFLTTIWDSVRDLSEHKGLGRASLWSQHLASGKAITVRELLRGRGKDGKAPAGRPALVFPGAYWLGILVWAHCCQTRWICSTGFQLPSVYCTSPGPYTAAFT